MKTLISDFDGTLTKIDFYQAIIDLKMTARDCMRFWDKYVDGKITHFEAMKGIMASIHVPNTRLSEALDYMQFDPDIPAAFTKLAREGWKVAVISAGSEWYIRRHFERAKIPMTTDLNEFKPGLVYVAANPGHLLENGTGLHLTLPVDSPFFSDQTGIDKLAATKYFLQNSERAVFAGDGRPDLDSALLMAPENRFATGWLADELRTRREGFHRFSRWSKIPPHLLRK